MITETKLEEICDELAEVIDEVEGEIDVSQTIDSIVAEHSSGNAESLRNDMLVKFNEIFKCNPFVYAENSIDDVVWGKENVLLDNLNDLDPISLDDIIPLEELDDIL